MHLLGVVIAGIDRIRIFSCLQKKMTSVKFIEYFYLKSLGVRIEITLSFLFVTVLINVDLTPPTGFCYGK